MKRLLIVGAGLFLAASTCAAQPGGAPPPMRDRGAGGAPPADASGQGMRWQPPTPPGRWRLGVRVQNTDAGCLVRTVEPGSAAARAGIEANDRILCVDGYQVGYVGGILYDVADECARRADPQGNVTLLVQNGRNGQFVNVPARLGRSASGLLVGSVALDQALNLSPGAVTVVKLVEAPPWGGRPAVVAEERVRWGGRFPIPYELGFNPAEVAPGRRYGLTAEVIDQGRVVAATRGLTDYRPGTNRVDLLCAASSGPPLPPPNPNVGQEIASWYRRYFGFDPAPNRLLALMQLHQAGNTLRDVRIYMLSSTEFFDLCGRDVPRYLSRFFELTRGRAPSRDELAGEQHRFNEVGGNRPIFVRQAFDRLNIR